LYKNRRFQPEISKFCHFCTKRTTFSYLSKEYTPLNGFRQSARVFTKQRFHFEISRFVILALGAPVFSDFQQSPRVSTKHRCLEFCFISVVRWFFETKPFCALRKKAKIGKFLEAENGSWYV